ncbi:MAG: energy-coupling factor transporter ATPase [Clostridia bacterium]|nr:energy-coupling factor transporter ATPase [Clostridia bacterium]
MEPIIQTENLCYAYEEDNGRKVPVLKNVSLTVGRGEYVAILGHNGSGKSTLAKLLNLILTPDSGRVIIAGREITSPDLTEDELYEVRRSMGMVFQNPDNQLVATIVEEDVAFGPENLGVPSEEIRRRVDEALAMVGMQKYARHEPHRLSGGQKQRIAIAGIIAMLPDCIIFDESTAMLDPIGRRDVLSIMDELNRERGITVITITHYMNEAARADRVIVLNDGEIYMEGTPAQIFARPDALTAIGLDVPQCTDLIHALRTAGIDMPGDCVTPEQCADAICAACAARGMTFPPM